MTSSLAAVIFALSALVAITWQTEDTSSEIIRCYHCNSAYQDNCGTPFNKTLAKKYLVDCDNEELKPESAKDKRPVGCRIVDAQVLNKGRIIRQCAYSGDNVNQMKKSGSRGVVSYITQCSESECNNAMSVSLVSCFTVLLPITAAMLLRY